MILRGRCHCGNLDVALETSTPPPELPLRACQCGFCRRHGARTMSDPAGRVMLRIRDEDQLTRYRFGLGITDFLVCRRCGVYVAAVVADGGRLLATVNANTMDDAALSGRVATPVSYDAEPPEARVARRRARWTPASVVVGPVEAP